MPWKSSFPVPGPAGSSGPTAGGRWVVPLIVLVVGMFATVLDTLPIAIIGAVAAMLVFPRIRPTSWPKFDFTSGALSLALFVVIELQVEKPLLDVRVFRSWSYTNSLLLIVVVSIGLTPCCSTCRSSCRRARA